MVLVLNNLKPPKGGGIPNYHHSVSNAMNRLKVLNKQQNNSPVELLHELLPAG